MVKKTIRVITTNQKNTKAFKDYTYFSKIGLKEFYSYEYPTDRIGKYIDSDTTFGGLLFTLVIGDCVYDYMGECDSVIRERLFKKLACMLDKPYEYVHNLWLGGK